MSGREGQRATRVAAGSACGSSGIGTRAKKGDGRHFCILERRHSHVTHVYVAILTVGFRMGGFGVDFTGAKTDFRGFIVFFLRSLSTLYC